jgi:PAS domain S-box-containing protein
MQNYCDKSLLVKVDLKMKSSEMLEIDQLKSNILQLEDQMMHLTEKMKREDAISLSYKTQLEEEKLAHKKVEEAIERGKREWEASFDAVMDMVILTDDTAKVIRCNASTCRYFARNYLALLNQPIEDLFFGNHPVQSDIFDSESKEVQFPGRQGWFHIANYKVMLNDSAYGTVHVIKDITESRNSQERLRDSEEKLRKVNDELESRVQQRTQELIETNQELEKEIKKREGVQDFLAKEKELLSITLFSIRDGVISTDKDGLITLFNQAAESITGYSRVEVLGKHIQDVIIILDEKTNQVSSDPLFKLLNKSSSKPIGHLTLVDRSGSKLLISSSSAPVCNNEGSLVGYVMVINNITEQKRIESQLMLSQKMESIGQLAAGIAHEINTPMQYVGDNTHFFKEAFHAMIEMQKAHEVTSTANLDMESLNKSVAALKELKEHLDVDFYISEVPAAIQQSLDGIDRVRQIVLAMKSFSHPRQKEKRPADINQGIDTTVTISRNEWKYIADLITELDPNLPPVVCEINEINQVILNMIINSAQAIQEAQDNGKSRPGQIVIKTRAKGDFVEICITDSGMGIPAAYINRIFDPFFTTKEVGKGTGQGLSLAHNIIVKQHHGSIHVESEPGQGTTFTLQLPVSFEEKADLEEE